MFDWREGPANRFVISAPRSLRLRAPLALLAACAGCSGPAAHGSSVSASEKVLNVYNWSDYIQPSVVADVQNEYGIRVNYDVLDLNEIMKIKCLTEDSKCDLVGLSGASLDRHVHADCYHKLH